MEPDCVPLPSWLNLVNYSALVALGLSVPASFLLLAINSRDAGAGQIQLPMHADEPVTKQKDFENLLISHVDTSLKHDGEPVDLAAFWRTVSSAMYPDVS